jgi:hypothetical protein
VVTGSQIRIDEATIADNAARTKIAQDTLNEQTRQFNATFAEQQAQAQRQYELDKLQFGEQQASRAFNEKMAQLQYDLNLKLADAQEKYNMARLGLDERRLGMDQENSAFNRADTLAGRELQALGMLADRSGPQDWVKYNSLLNGLSAPDPQATQNIDVMSLFNPMRQQVQGAQPPVTGGAPAAGMPSPAPSPAPAQPGGQPPPIQTQPIETPGMRPGMPLGGGQLGGNIDIGRIFGGGAGQPRGMAVVGDAPGRRTGVEEMVVNLNPDPNDRIGVIPIGNNPIPRGVPRAAEGGVYDAGIGTGTIQVNRYSPQQLGNQPFIQKLTGQAGSRPYGAFGASLNNPRIGVSNMPWALNYKTLSELNPSEFDQAQGLYGAYGVDFRDVYEQARRAAPTGGTLPVATYGR